MIDISNHDWKLYRSKIATWQEAYMERLTKEYIQLLSGEAAACDKFWDLEKRINQDKQRPGVIVRLRRSDMPIQLMNLMQDGAISWDDLAEFSPELQQIMRRLLGQF